ncbi:MAG: zinc ABC transporter substrate-binding protein, partial [Proteobacteria bacterium]|nr:zinc ABC transporter substrate-binding protein [Pseudomonadota bacterium]
MQIHSLRACVIRLICAGLLTSPAAALAEKPIKVSATLPTFASLVQEIGGERVEVSAVASPRFNPHFIEPRPSDVLRVKRADLFVHGGLDLEGWRLPLLDAVARSELRPGGDRQLDLSIGIPLLGVPTTPVSRSQGDIHLFGNPHFWTDPQMGVIMARAIAAKLTALDPAHAAEYSAREAIFSTKIQGKIAEWQEAASQIRGKKVVGYHDEWLYLLRFLGVNLEQVLEPKPGIPPSPQRLQFIRQHLR